MDVRETFFSKNAKLCFCRRDLKSQLQQERVDVYQGFIKVYEYEFNISPFCKKDYHLHKPGSQYDYS